MMFDAIVIGTGGVGSTAVYHLARRGESPRLGSLSART